MLTVHLQHPSDPEVILELRARLAPEVGLTAGDIPAGADYEILVHDCPAAADLAASRRLRAVIVPYNGVPLETVVLLQRFPAVSLHHAPYNVAATAETALALLLAAAKRIPLHDRALRRHLWSPPPRTGAGSVTLDGGNALVLGYGRIGQRIAAGCRALGMQVKAICRSPRTDTVDPTFGPRALPELLPATSALLICVPHTAATDGWIGPAELALLPAHAVLVNVARGSIIDQRALYQVLRDRRIFGAGLDVWYRYPSPAQREQRIPVPPADLPFHELDNVVMSPHRAGWSEETEQARCAMLAAMLNAAARGEALPNRIDTERGY